MESTTEDKSRPTRKQMIIQMATTIFGIIGAMLLDRFGYGIIGWFLGGVIIGTGILFAYKNPEERWTVVNVAIVVFTGILMTTIYNLLNL